MLFFLYRQPANAGHANYWTRRPFDGHINPHSFEHGRIQLPQLIQVICAINATFTTAKIGISSVYGKKEGNERYIYETMEIADSL